LKKEALGKIPAGYFTKSFFAFAIITQSFVFLNALEDDYRPQYAILQVIFDKNVTIFPQQPSLA
jgi:hypothetical protein